MEEIKVATLTTYQRALKEDVAYKLGKGSGNCDLYAEWKGMERKKAQAKKKKKKRD